MAIIFLKQVFRLLHLIGSLPAVLDTQQWLFFAGQVPCGFAAERSYGGGSATDFHRLPFEGMGRFIV
jgi:hypothetical protein